MVNETVVCAGCGATIQATDLPCPVCQDGTLHKRVNEEQDEIWVCCTCPAVVFTYHNAFSIRRLTDVLE